MNLDDVAGRAGLTGTALVTCGDRTWASGDLDARFVIYSVTKPVISAAYLLLAAEGAVDLDASAVPGDTRFAVSLRRLLTHTSGIPDYGRLPEYRATVSSSPSRPWSDEEFLARALTLGRDFEPGAGWAYSNTGYLLLRRVLDSHGGLASLLPALGFADAQVAEDLSALDRAVPAVSTTIGDGRHGVAGRYHPCWVGHRTLVTTARDLHAFWIRPPSAFLDPATHVPVGFETPGFFDDPAYGLGVMTDARSPLGLVIGHGGGGPGYSAGVFAAPEHDAVAIVLEAVEDFPSQNLALELLKTAVRGDRPGD
jgi:D-alanyl-D-alanine carboxypeptidase